MNGAVVAAPHAERPLRQLPTTSTLECKASISNSQVVVNVVVVVVVVVLQPSQQEEAQHCYKVFI